MAIKPIYYMQNDPRWGQHNYSAKGESKTIASSGCGVTSAAIIIQTLRPDKNVTPVITAKWSMTHGYKVKNQGTAYSYFKPQFEAYGISCKMLNTNNLYHNPKSSIHDKAKKLLKEGHFLIAVMGPGTWTRGGHYVVPWKVDDNNNVYINDPASKAENRTKNKWATFKNEVKYYWVISYGKKEKTNTNGNLYKKMDVLSKKIETINKDAEIYHVKDMKNGWSIVTTNTHVGYCKNTLIKDTTLSKYPQHKLKAKAGLYKRNKSISKKLATLDTGTAVRVITKRKYWTNVVTEKGKGYVSTKKIVW